MKKILFVCLGNICRSPMAEYVFKYLAEQAGVAKEFFVASAATSDEAVGCDVHRGTQNVLKKHGIPCPPRKAVQLTQADYMKYDLIIGMEQANVRNILNIFGSDTEGKVRRLLDRDVADPWYTGDFDSTYRDVLDGCKKILEL